jgi:ATP-binding cassette subfamily B protein
MFREMGEEKSGKKYGVLKNSLFMLQEARKNVPSVIWLAVLDGLIAVAVSVIELYVAPSILKNLEMHGTLSGLLSTILFFTAGITAASAVQAYVWQNMRYGRIELRDHIVTRVRYKMSTSSYPLREKQAFINLLVKANDALNDNDKASEAIWTTFTGLVQNILGFAIYLYLLKSVDPVVILVTVVTAVLGYLVNYRANEWNYRHREEEEEICKHVLYVQDEAQDRYLAKDIRIFGMGEWLCGLHEKYMRLYLDFSRRRERRYLAADLTDLILGILRNGIAYFYLLYMVLDGRIGAAAFLLYFAAVGGFTTWIGGIMENIATLHRQGLELESVREFLDYREIFRMEEGMPLKWEPGASYTIELRDVSFRYSGSEAEPAKEVFSHLNLRIRPGEKLAVVGLNGAGKTTLVKLICGFYDPDEGEVLLNGVNIKVYDRRDYYRLISGVFQDFSVIASTIAVNIAQDTQKIDMERVADCVEKAGLKKKIESLPRKYDTLLDRFVYTEAVELSGGELQRLMIARLLYKDSPIVVLDEPTAALDPIAESDIYQKYNALTRGKSAVFISHRLASTRFCDRILLIEDGRIAEEGTHEELLANGKRYAELFELQSRYYQKTEQF